MTGDGELQEGQIWESLQPAANERLADITVIVDHNKFQSDTAVAAVSDLGDLEAKFRIFGWEVRRGDGHDFGVLRDALAHFATITDKPKVFIADTIKGKGVSFMEGIACGDQTYHFHAGAPSLENYVKATRELITRVNAKLDARPAAGGADVRAAADAHRPKNPEKIVLPTRRTARDGASRPEIVVMDADLRRIAHRSVKAECRSDSSSAARRTAHGVRRVEWRCAAAAVVHSFACFLSTRATSTSTTTPLKRNESSIPQRSPVSFRRARPLASIGPRHLGDWRRTGPDRLRPCSEREARLAIRWAVEQNPKAPTCDSSTCRRIPYTMPADYVLQVVRG